MHGERQISSGIGPSILGMDPSVDAPTGNTEPLHDRIFRGRTLRGSQFIACDLGDVVVRGSDVAGIELDSPWLLEGDDTLLVNGVDVVPLATPS